MDPWEVASLKKCIIAWEVQQSILYRKSEALKLYQLINDFPTTFRNGVDIMHYGYGNTQAPNSHLYISVLKVHV